jgi:2-keto-4-pentenoate hydratase/2-oxohepta-3-ene-1,7-dioic acid hydratase in catechol pathway
MVGGQQLEWILSNLPGEAMKLVTFSTRERIEKPGYLLEASSEVIDLSSCYKNTLQVIQSSEATPSDTVRFPLSEVRLHAPLHNPPRIFCIGLNYRDHAIESRLEIPKFPVVFFKMIPSIIGPEEAIVLPRETAEPDYEAEMAVVIGKGGYRIPAEAAMEHVYGYTIVNDVSARDVQFSTSQWSLSKSLPTFCPIGPSIVTKDEIADPHKLRIQLEINQESLQDSNTSELIFGVTALIEYISSLTPLLPGDVISTGTPSGVGFARVPKRWLRNGDQVSITIEGLGTLKNSVTTEEFLYSR